MDDGQELYLYVGKFILFIMLISINKVMLLLKFFQIYLGFLLFNNLHKNN